MKPVACLIAFVLAALATASPALAAPAAVSSPAGSDVAVVFKRSCGECAEDLYCEFAYPGAPVEHVACVSHTSRKGLYRRYAATLCDNDLSATRCDGQVLSYGVPSSYDFFGSQYASLDACEAACVGAGKTSDSYIVGLPYYCKCFTGTCTPTTQFASNYFVRQKVDCN